MIDILDQEMMWDKFTGNRTLLCVLLGLDSFFHSSLPLDRVLFVTVHGTEGSRRASSALPLELHMLGNRDLDSSHDSISVPSLH